MNVFRQSGQEIFCMAGHHLLYWPTGHRYFYRGLTAQRPRPRQDYYK
jgi:hypothetical protein